MSRNIQPPPSITDIGIDKYMDDLKDDHKGYGWHGWLMLLDSGISMGAIAKLIGTSRTSVYKYRKHTRDFLARND